MQARMHAPRAVGGVLVRQSSLQASFAVRAVCRQATFCCPQAEGHVCAPAVEARATIPTSADDTSTRVIIVRTFRMLSPPCRHAGRQRSTSSAWTVTANPRLPHLVDTIPRALRVPAKTTGIDVHVSIARESEAKCRSTGRESQASGLPRRATRCSRPLGGRRASGGTTRTEIGTRRLLERRRGGRQARGILS